MTFEIKKDETGTEYLEDEERGIVFRENDRTRRGEVGEGFYMKYGFDLIWKGHTCKVAAHEENMSNRFELRDWNVHIYVIPPELRAEKETIKQILTEAFEIFGFNFNPNKRTRDVTFSMAGRLGDMTDIKTQEHVTSLLYAAAETGDEQAVKDIYGV